MMRWKPVVVQSEDAVGGLVVMVGHPLVDAYVEFLRARARPNTIRAVAFDLKVFFTVVDKTPARVTSADVMSFIAGQRSGGGDRKVVSIDRSDGLSSRTIRRRLSSVSGFYAYLMVRGDTSVNRNPVPRGLVTRRERSGPKRRAPLIRTPVTLPKVLSPGEVDRLVAALRTDRDRAMVDAMLLGGLRRCEVLGLRLEDVRAGEGRVFIADGKGGRQRLIPMSGRFFNRLARYLDSERPNTATDAVFVVLKGPRRGSPLSAAGLDEIMRGARGRAGLEHASCHELRHTCLTRLREAGMSIEALQAQAGHASIETTRVYLHLTNDWLAGEYRKASEVIDAQNLEAIR